MPAVLQRRLEGTPPGWLRKVETRVICGVFAKAFEVDAPHMRGLRPAEALYSLREFTAEQMEVALADGRASDCRARLGVRARALGTRVRRVLPIGQKTRTRLVRYVYRGIGIELHGPIPGELRFGPCSFAQRYSPACCALMSAFDEGFVCGLMGLCGPLEFESRLTEGSTCCLARIR